MSILKNAKFDADFESSENVVKNLGEKRYQRKSDKKTEFFTFISVCKRF